MDDVRTSAGSAFFRVMKEPALGVSGIEPGEGRTKQLPGRLVSATYLGKVTTREQGKQSSAYHAEQSSR